MKNGYIGYQLVEKTDFYKWLEGSSVDYLENKNISTNETDAKTSSTIKEAYSGQDLSTPNTIYLKSILYDEIHPVEIDDLTKEFIWFTLTTRKEFEQWVNS
ncbi:hypothetical protein [Mangrovimonas sp. DI 80]|uniref:hypothetical protein n=1 Tax=Mangrovimonas sp. DI 80 TaxID=1779330 RepID=UPI0009770C91|nr:hypothetical protein [Mangrovimonas sp. DI 80]OMP29695.1 hypothetical protein BKM32_16225 [Mangrovimonas sp. DI 80]